MASRTKSKKDPGLEPQRREGELLEGIHEEELSHEPVLVHEILAFASSGGREVIVDGTLGLGGHAEAMLKELPEIQTYIGMDVDPLAVEEASRRLRPFTEGKKAKKLCLSHRSYVDVDKAMKAAKVPAADVALLDLGASTYQLTSNLRGFSITRDGPLDMRMNPDRGPTARELLESWSANELRDVLAQGEVRNPGRISRAIKKHVHELKTTKDLANLVQRSTPVDPAKRKYIHPATLVFQALRIAVNKELDNVEAALPKFFELLKPGGILMVISFHSLEDRLVKRFFQDLVRGDDDPSDFTKKKKDLVSRAELLAKRPLVPGEAELSQNAASRSAKLRVIRKL